VENLQCDDCKQAFTPHTWNALVQVRQKVAHKRTFLFLEQLILKHNVLDKCLKVKEANDGLDFQFKNRAQSQRLIDFVQTQVSSRQKTSKKLVSQDFKNNIANYKYTTVIEIAPVCKDDLVILPKALQKEIGGLGPLVLVYKISQAVHIVDVLTMKTMELDHVTYWKHCFTALCGRERLTEFVVLNIEEADFDQNTSMSRAAIKQKYKMVQVEVARASDFGVNDTTFIVNCHLGDILNFNDTVLGYDLVNINLEEIEDLERQGKTVPQVVIVRKAYPKLRKRQKQRYWKLKHLPKEEGEEEPSAKQGKKKGEKGGNKGKEDYEMFLQDLEEDPELRSQVNLYRVNVFHQKLG